MEWNFGAISMQKTPQCTYSVLLVHTSKYIPYFFSNPSKILAILA